MGKRYTSALILAALFMIFVSVNLSISNHALQSDIGISLVGEQHTEKGNADHTNNTANTNYNMVSAVRQVRMEGLAVVPEDYISPAGLAPEKKKSYTLMIYMNGSDLESMYAAASNDIREMLSAGLNDEETNLLIFTGGSEDWHTGGIPDQVNAIFQIRNNSLVKLADAGENSVAAPEVLAGFIRFGITQFPASRYGLILWNHGAGSVVGFGYDERYEDRDGKTEMLLTDIESALYSSGMQQKLDFLGFDTCLMSTLEMAEIAAGYAEYLIASEEVEAAEGWDYAFLGQLQPENSAAEIAELIIRYYGDSYEQSGLEDFVTLSAVDLSRLPAVTEAFEELAVSAGKALRQGSYNRLSKSRSKTRSFGSGGEDGETDMVDIREMAVRLEDFFPKETRKLLAALEEAIAYKYGNQEQDIGGLAVYYPFYNKENLEADLEVYRAMDILPNYADYIGSFGRILAADLEVDLAEALNYQQGQLSRLADEEIIKKSGINGLPMDQKPIQDQKSIQDEMWNNIDITLWKPANEGKGLYLQVSEGQTLTTLNGQEVCMYGTKDGLPRRCWIPIRLNGEDANLMVTVSDEYPAGRVLGAIPTDQDVFRNIDKKLITLKTGDRIAIRYYCLQFDDNGWVIDHREGDQWVVGEEFTVGREMVLRQREAGSGHLLIWKLTDVRNNSYYVGR